MQVIIPLDSKCPVSPSKVNVFADFVKGAAIRALFNVFTRYREIIEPRMQRLGIDVYVNDLESLVEDIVYTTISGNTLVIVIRPLLVGGKRLDLAMKAIDFGSMQTGTPQRLFMQSLYRIRDGREQLHQNYLRRI